MLNISLARYQFEFIVNSDIHLPEYAGSSLRGVFGHALKKLACITKQQTCDGCLLRNQCAYTQLFEPIAQKSQLNQSNKSPVPYVIHAPTWGKKSYKIGETLCFGMTLIGEHAIKQLPLIMLAWQQAFARGVCASKGTAVLKAVYLTSSHQKHCIYQEGGEIQPHQSTIELKNVQHDASQLEAIVLQVLTPLRLQKNGKALPPKEINAYTLLMSTLRRISLMDHLHGLGVSIQAETAKSLSEAAKNIEISHTLRWQDWERYSSRQKKTMKLGGCVGDITLKGDLTPFLPYLKLGEYLHVGKEASFGLGQYELI